MLQRAPSKQVNQPHAGCSENFCIRLFPRWKNPRSLLNPQAILLLFSSLPKRTRLLWPHSWEQTLTALTLVNQHAVWLDSITFSCFRTRVPREGNRIQTHRADNITRTPAPDRHTQPDKLHTHLYNQS